MTNSFLMWCVLLEWGTGQEVRSSKFITVFSHYKMSQKNRLMQSGLTMNLNRCCLSHMAGAGSNI